MANNSTIQYFISLFPEFDKINPGTVEAFLEVATLRVPPSVWGSVYKYATALLTAHMLTCSGRSGLGAGGGVVTGESVGDLSRNFAQMGQGSGDQELLSTRYGIDFVALRRETVISAGVSGTTLPPCETW